MPVVRSPRGTAPCSERGRSRETWEGWEATSEMASPVGGEGFQGWAGAEGAKGEGEDAMEGGEGDGLTKPYNYYDRVCDWCGRRFKGPQVSGEYCQLLPLPACYFWALLTHAVVYPNSQSRSTTRVSSFPNHHETKPLPPLGYLGPQGALPGAAGGPREAEG